MIPIIALCTSLLVGATAVAVDLSLNTHSRRTLQNVTDGAALAGARDITWTANQTGPTHATQVTAVTDALKVLNSSLGWGVASIWYAIEEAKGNCGSSSVDASGNPVCQVSDSFQNYTFSVNTPPLGAHQASFNDDPHYVEVNVTRSHSNNVAGVVGLGSSTEGAHSVGYHFPVNLPFGFALYSSTIAQGGNQGEVVSGDVYSYRDIQPQSNGKSGFCVLNGFIVLGSPQYPDPLPNPDPAAGQLQQHDPTFTPKTAQTIQQDTQNCTNTPGGYVAQTKPLGSCPPVNIQGSSLQTTYDAKYTHACIATSNPPAPALVQPSGVLGDSFYTLWDASKKGTFQITGALTPGVYEIQDNGFCNNASNCADVLIDGQQLTGPSGCRPGDATYYNLCLYGVTFILDNGATLHLRNKASVLLAPPFYPGYPGTPLSTNNKSDGHIPVYAASGNAVTVMLEDLSVTLVMTGTVYMPSGSMVDQHNAALVITGQAIVKNWQVQSGNHTNPVLTYDATQAAPQPEILRLAE